MMMRTRHILLKCPTYRVLRNKYISRYWINLNNVSVKDLIANENSDIVRGVAIFIFYALEARSRH